MKNRYPGKCSCGAFVDSEEGTVSKVSGKWQITCDACTPAHAVRYEVQRVYYDEDIGEYMHEPVPVLFATLDEARAFATKPYGYATIDLEATAYYELHKIELRGAHSAFPAGFIESIAKAA